jgi:hypothetical protein
MARFHSTSSSSVNRPSARQWSSHVGSPKASVLEQSRHLRDQPPVPVPDVAAEGLQPVEDALADARDLDDQRLLIGVGDHDAPARGEDPDHLPQRDDGAAQVLDDTVCPRPGEGLGRERKVVGVRPADDGASCRGRRRHGRRRLDPDTSDRAEGDDVDTRSGPDVDDGTRAGEQRVGALLVGPHGGPQAHALLPVGGLCGIRAGVDVRVRLAHRRSLASTPTTPRSVPSMRDESWLAPPSDGQQ